MGERQPGSLNLNTMTYVIGKARVDLMDESTLPGCAGPLGSPGGATDLGPVGVDTTLVAAMPRQAG